ncbi:MAG: single-stranded DNA-binding protein [Oscillospiraceae bacterium]|nr:single-stranded DNA-binding protein [Oscillospiraceae bacterium]
MYNKAVLVGRLTADPELKSTPNGISVTSFSIAVSRAFAPKGGERQTDFLDIVAWRQTAEFICRYFTKGKAILIEGAIQTRTYVDKNGQNRRAWEIVADSAHFVESKNASVGGGAPVPNDAQAPPAPAYSSGSVDDFADIDDDGDLPF